MTSIDAPRVPSQQPYGVQWMPPTPPQLDPGARPPASRKRAGVVVAAIVGTLAVVGAVLAGALLLFGTKTLDTAQVESQIARLAEAQFGVAATDIGCPADVEAEAGATFTCDAQMQGQAVSFTVEQTDGDGHVVVTNDDTYAQLTAIEESLARQVGDQAGVEVVASCDADGRTVLVASANHQIPCTATNATDPTDSIDVIATLDPDGHVNYEVV